MHVTAARSHDVKIAIRAHPDRSLETPEKYAGGFTVAAVGDWMRLAPIYGVALLRRILTVQYLVGGRLTRNWTEARKGPRCTSPTQPCPAHLPIIRPALIEAPIMHIRLTLAANDECILSC